MHTVTSRYLSWYDLRCYQGIKLQLPINRSLEDALISHWVTLSWYYACSTILMPNPSVSSTSNKSKSCEWLVWLCWDSNPHRKTTDALTDSAISDTWTRRNQPGVFLHLMDLCPPLNKWDPKPEGSTNFRTNLPHQTLAYQRAYAYISLVSSGLWANS